MTSYGSFGKQENKKGWRKYIHIEPLPKRSKNVHSFVVSTIDPKYSKLTLCAKTKMNSHYQMIKILILEFKEKFQSHHKHVEERIIILIRMHEYKQCFQLLS